MRKDAAVLINSLIEFSQRKELAALEKGRMMINYKEGDKGRAAEMLVFENAAFIFNDGKIKKLTDKIEDSDMEEVSKFAEAQKNKGKVSMNSEIFALLKKEFGDFEISV